MPILGIVDSSKRIAADTGAMYSLQSVIVGSAGLASLTFSNIPQTYTHLQIRVTGRSTVSGTGDNLYMRFNGDTGSSYRLHQLYGDGTSIYSGATGSLDTSFFNIALSGSTSASNIFGAGTVDILDYTNTNKNKVFRSLSGSNYNGASLGFVIFRSGLWVNTAAITSITCYPGSGSFAQNSIISLYGLKSA
jgi:hypothetical protein